MDIEKEELIISIKKISETEIDANKLIKCSKEQLKGLMMLLLAGYEFEEVWDYKGKANLNKLVALTRQ
ncbi:hypothetical protein [Anaerosalibacter massiliensis]|uniref:hypothetical protein n=1 Tax=Anaerosalibacter massiliensis TaxID=1347392 RepID=UPI0005B2A7B8|nr:hypothetical protein [Anaerosalibacter massiliensis]